jgi:protein-S-isoprenylcysteine O-methyltransferase Ste14
MKSPQRTAPPGKCRAAFFEVAGWLIPLLTSAPSLFIWTGLMTMPLVVYVVIMFLSIFNPAIRFSGQPPSGSYFLAALDVLFLGGPHWPDKVISILGVLIMIYATVYLQIRRKKGLVTSGPYRFVRNPQYFGATLFTINLTSRSFREVLGDVGWLGPTGTLLVWVGTVAAYILLAVIEQAHLSNVFGDAYESYRRRTAFMIPFTGSHRWSVELAITVVASVLLLGALVVLNRILFP